MPDTLISKAFFGKMPDGETVEVFTLTNRQGCSMEVLSLGGIIRSLYTPDLQGHMADVMVGFDHVDGYLADTASVGVIVGRYANRIAGGRFPLDGKMVQVSTNEGPNCLHGGYESWGKRIWEVIPEETPEGPSIQLFLSVPDGEEGFPGQLEVTVRYLLRHDGALQIDYEALTSAPTIINLTHHAYFHLGGQAGIGDHWLQVYSDKYVKVGEGSIPTGELVQVAGTPLDFRHSRRIGDALGSGFPDVELQKGLDFTWVLSQPGAEHLQASLYEPHTGRRLDVYTDVPGLQVYTANYLNITGKAGEAFGKQSSICLETQHFPDSPNHPHFPSTVLRPGEVYRQSTLYRFGVGSEAGGRTGSTG